MKLIENMLCTQFSHEIAKCVCYYYQHFIVITMNITIIITIIIIILETGETAFPQDEINPCLLRHSPASQQTGVP